MASSFNVALEGLSNAAKPQNSPAAVYQDFETNDLNNQFRKEQNAQEAIKTKEISEAWAAQNADREARKASRNIVANDGYDPASSPDYVPAAAYDPNTNPQTRPHVLGGAGDAGSVAAPGTPVATPTSSAPAVSPPAANSFASAAVPGASTAPPMPTSPPQGLAGPIVNPQSSTDGTVQYVGPRGDKYSVAAGSDVSSLIANGYKPVAPVSAPAASNQMSAALTPAQAPPQQGVPPATATPSLIPTQAAVPAPTGGSTEPTLPPIDLRNPATYHVEQDEDKYRESMDRSGHGDYGQLQSTNRQKALNSVYETQKNQYEAAAKKNQAVSDAALAVVGSGPINLDNPDQNAVEAQKAQWITNARFQMRRLMQAGIIKPQEEAAYEQIFNQGYSPQLYQTVKGIADSADGGVKHMKMEQEAVESRQRVLNGQSTRAKEDADRKKTYLGTMGQEAQALVPDNDAINRFVTRQPGELRPALREIADNPKLTPQEKVDKIKAMGMTESQSVAAKQKETSADATQSYRDILIAQRDERESFTEGQKIAGRNIDKAQNARDSANLMKLQADERKAGLERSRLAQQIQNAKDGKEFMYVQKGGGAKPSSLMSNPDDKTAAISDMQQRHDALTDDLKEIVNQKYDITKDTGTVSRAEALSKYESEGKGEKSVAPSQKQTAEPLAKPAIAPPAQKPAPAAAPKKTASAAMVSAYAKKLGITEAQAKQKAEAEGFMIQ